jgi:hypothetical protein
MVRRTPPSIAASSPAPETVVSPFSLWTASGAKAAVIAEPTRPVMMTS